MKKRLVLTKQFTSPTFLYEELSRYTLHLEINDAYFYCWATENKEHNPLWLECYSLPTESKDDSILEGIKEVYKDHGLLNSIKWGHVCVRFNNQFFTQIPASLFQKEYSTYYIQLAKGNLLSNEQEVKYDSILTDKVITVYTHETATYNWLMEQYPFVVVSSEHQSSVLCEKTRQKNDSLTEANVYLYKDHFFVLIHQNEQLLFCNRFLYQTTEDIAFFLLYALNELAVVLSETTTTLWGEIDTKSPIVTLLSDYLPEIVLKDTRSDYGNLLH